MNSPLDGINVLDFTQTIAGPFCSMVLAELGAEVIKVENPGTGDDARNWAPFLEDESGYFFTINRSKKSMALNLKDPKGKEIAISLAKKSDVIVVYPRGDGKVGDGLPLAQRNQPQTRLLFDLCLRSKRTLPGQKRL